MAPAPAPAQIDATMMQAMVRSMAGEFLASTALSRVQSDVSTLRADFHRFTEDVHQVNVALGKFRDDVVAPVQRELEYLRYNLGARTEDSVGALDKLTHHLQDQLNLLLKARGLNPEAKDPATGETLQDRMGLSRPPSGVDFEANGVVAIDDTLQLHSELQTLLRQVSTLTTENEQLRQGLQADDWMPFTAFKPGDCWVDPRGRVWKLQPSTNLQN